MSPREEIQKEVDNNYQFFLKEKDKIPNYLLDKYVLIRKEEFIEYFDSVDYFQHFQKYYNYLAYKKYILFYKLFLSCFRI